MCLRPGGGDRWPVCLSPSAPMTATQTTSLLSLSPHQSHPLHLCSSFPVSHCHPLRDPASKAVSLPAASTGSGRERHKPNCQLCSLSPKPPATGASTVHSFPRTSDLVLPGMAEGAMHDVTWAPAGRLRGPGQVSGDSRPGTHGLPFLSAHCAWRVSLSKQESSTVQTTPTLPAMLVKPDLKPLVPLVSKKRSQD